MVAHSTQDNLRTLTDLGERRRLVRLRYRSRLTPAPALERVIEPYNLTQGKQDVMVRAYQLQPEEGWRYFMAHKIDGVQDAGEEFQPRRDITLASDEHAPIPAGPRVAHTPWTTELMHYRDLVSDALAEGVVSKRTLDQIKGYAESAGLRPEQIRFAHATLFSRCLGAVLRDGTVADEQVAEIRHVQRVLSGLGWGVVGSIK